MSKKMNTQVLVEGGIMVALAFVLGEIKLFHLPQGGSVTLGLMIPIIFYSLRHGVSAGILAGVVLGLLKLALGGYFVTVPQVVLDYPIAFGALGLSGIFFKAIQGKEINHSGILRNICRSFGKIYRSSPFRSYFLRRICRRYESVVIFHRIQRFISWSRTCNCSCGNICFKNVHHKEFDR